MGWFGSKSKKTDAQIRQAERRAQRLAERRESGGIEGLAQKETVAERLAAIKAGERPVVVPLESEDGEEAAPIDLGYEFDQATGELTVSSDAEAKITDITAVPVKDLEGKKSLLEISGDFFIVAGKKPAGVENKIEAGESFVAREISPNMAAKISEIVAPS